MADNNIESRVAETILQNPETITVGDKTYTVAPPSAATIILVSEAVAHLPFVRFNEKRVLEDSLRYGRECKDLGAIGATVILGAKHINDREEDRTETIRKRRFFGLLPDKVEQKTIKGRLKREAIAKELMENTTPRELAQILGTLLGKMQVSDFFELTTFLTEINLIRPTKVETEPTASGQ